MVWYTINHILVSVWTCVPPVWQGFIQKRYPGSLPPPLKIHWHFIQLLALLGPRNKPKVHKFSEGLEHAPRPPLGKRKNIKCDNKQKILYLILNHCF